MFTSSIPGGLRRLATTEPGTDVVVRSLLGGTWTRAYLEQLQIRVNDRLRAGPPEAGGVWVETALGRRVLVPWEHAEALQVEWLGR
jgi:hypothetical protein